MKLKFFGALAGAALIIAPAAYAQTGAAMTAKAPASSTGGAMKMKASGGAAADSSSDGAKMASAKKTGHHVSKSEAAMNASEADTTRQLNLQQAQQTSPGGMSGGANR